MSSLGFIHDVIGRHPDALWLAISLLLAFAIIVTKFTQKQKEKASDQKCTKLDTLAKSSDDWKTFDWQSTPPRVLRPFKETYHITMAIQADDASNLITIDRDYLSRVQKRRQVIRDQGRRVHGCVPSGDNAVRELYSFLMKDFLPQRYPSIFALRKDGSIIHNDVTDVDLPTEWTDSDVHGALTALAETVEEDMFLLHETEDGHFSDAFVCCFPSGFDPSQKLGKLLRDIHGPVPSYEKIGSSMERFFSRLEVGKNVKRMNWSIQTHGELPAITGNHITEDDQSLRAAHDINPEECFLRVERQTLMRLPKTRAILFSFKTYLYPIPDLKAEGSGPQLADAIEGLKKGNAPGMWVYKGSVQWGERVCEYLRS